MKPSEYLKPMYKLYTGADAETTNEVAVQLGVSDTTARRHMEALVKEGVFKKVTVKRPNMRKPEVAYIKVK